MKKVAIASVCLWSILLGSAPLVVSATEYTNDNFQTITHEKPATFAQDVLGNFSGTTEGGKVFSQRAVVADIHVRLHRFTIDQAYFYISSFGLIAAESDTVALSIYLARAGWEEEVV